MASGSGSEVSVIRSSSSANSLPTKLAEAEVTRECSKNRSFAEVLQLKS